MKYLITATRTLTAYQRAEFDVEAESENAAWEIARKKDADCEIKWEDSRETDPSQAEFEIEEDGPYTEDLADEMPDPEDQPVPEWAKAMVANYRKLANIPASATDWRIYLVTQELADHLDSDEKIQAMRWAFENEGPEA